MPKKNALEKDFDQAIKEINAQLALSANALKTANEIAQKNGFEYLVMPYYYSDEHSEKEYEKLVELTSQIDYSALYSQLEDAGWHMSSIGC